MGLQAAYELHLQEKQERREIKALINEMIRREGVSPEQRRREARQRRLERRQQRIKRRKSHHWDCALLETLPAELRKDLLPHEEV